MDPHDTIARWVDTHRHEQIEFLQKIVRVPTDTPPGNNAPAAATAAALLASLGFAVERHPVPPKVLAERGMQSGINLIVRHRFGPGGSTIALNAHGDVVPPGEGWTKPPYGGIIQDGRMYGRGVAVSKSDIATYAYALAALRSLSQRDAPCKGAVELHFTYDEELGGLAGPGYLLSRGLTRPDYVIGAGFSYAVVTAHNGCLQLEVTIHGKAGHGAMPDAARDAFRAGTILLNALYAEADRLKTKASRINGIRSPTLIVGLLNGGINTNVVPDRLALRLDRRIIPDEVPAEVEANVREVIENATRNLDGIRVDIRRLLLARPLTPLPGYEPLLHWLLVHATRVFGEVVSEQGVPLYTDARLYAEHGIPIVMYGAGPRTIGESNAKRPDENLLLEDLHRATQVVASAVYDLLSANVG